MKRAFTEKNFPRTWGAVQKGLLDQVSPGIVAGFWRKGDPEIFHTAAWGVRKSAEFKGPPMAISTLFDLASVTKVFGTSLLTAILVERGWLEWETPIQSVFSDFEFPKIRVKHLLTHTAGYSAWEPFWERILEICAVSNGFELQKISVSRRQCLMRELIFSEAPLREVGTQVLYSDLSFILLGFVLEKVTSMPLDMSIQKWIWNPMGLKHSFFVRTYDEPLKQALRGWFPGPPREFAATENCSWRQRVLEGEVHDDNCWAMGGYGGHAGAFSNIEDLLLLIKNLMEGFFSDKILNAMWSSPFGGRTLGWDLRSGTVPSTGRYFSSHTVGHLGFTGTSLWIDLEAGIGVVLLSNRVHPTRENLKFKSFRSVFHDALREDLRELSELGRTS